MEEAEVDVAIIGAGKSCLQKLNTWKRTLKAAINLGLGGIAFARFYLDTHPHCRLMIFEKDGCIGGVWSASM